MSTHDRINNLLLLWQEQLDQGRDVPAGELCRDCPELEAELHEQIRVLRQMNGFLGPPGDAATVIGDLNGGGTSSNQDPKTPRGSLPALQVPGYELLRELGQGGMGVVYLARQVRLNRLVALKMIRSGSLAGTDELQRFQTEAEAVARLQHPNIVQVFEVGEHEGQPFFSLEFCPGGSLDKKLAGSPLPPREAASLVEMLSRAVQALHQANVIHRDLKPANILLAAEGTAKITDFGLAKKLDEASQTQTGSVVGTPSYMAPEQAEGKKGVGLAVDVYALGAILYECLTGRPPFKAATAMDTVQQVIHTEPVSPRQLQPQLPRDLETICLKCLQKEPRKRYASAAELAEDLRRWQAGEAVKARPVGKIERGLKWMRRHPAAATAYALLLVVVVLGGLGGGAVWLWQSSEQAREHVAYEKRQSEAARQEAERANRALAEIDYFHRVGRAYREWEEAEVASAEQLLQRCPPEQRRWEWDYVHRLCHANLRTFTTDIQNKNEAFSTDGRRLATVSRDHTVKIWNTETGQLLAACRGHSNTVEDIAFSQDSLLLVSASLDQTVRLWDTQSGREVLALRQTSAVTGAALSPDSQYVAACCGKEIKLWETRNHNEVRTFTGLTGIVEDVAFSPNGQWLAGCSAVAGKVSVKVWETQTGKVVLSTGHNDRIHRLAFSPDGKHLAGFSAFAKSVRVWDAHTGQIVFSLIGHTDVVNRVTYSRDGTHLATASQDHTARIWDAATGQELAAFRGHKRSVCGAVFSADGQRLVTASTDGTVKVWDPKSDPRAAVLRGHTKFITTVRFNPDGKTIVSSGCDGIRFWDVPSRRHERLVQAHARCTESMALSQDGRFLVSGGTDGSIKLWDAKTRKEIWTIAGHTIPVQTVAISPNSELIASASGKYDVNQNLLPGEIKLWNVQGGSEIHSLQGNTQGFNCVAFSPDSQRLVCGGDRHLAVWQVSTGQQLFSFLAHDDTIVEAAFSPNGQLIASASYDKTVKLWDASDGKAIYTFGGHSARVTCVAFSPDGQRIASGGDDHYIRIIVAHNGEEALSIKGTLGPVHSLAFSPDGHLLVSGGWDNLLRVWDARPIDRR